MKRFAFLVVAALGASVIIGLGLSGCARSMAVSYMMGGPAYEAATPRQRAPAGSLPSLDEEVWVIVRPAASVQTPPPDDVPGGGAMVTRLPVGDETKQVPLPLEHTSVAASISAYIASVNVTQTFHNPYDTKIEAVYVFPLPQNAAVNGFVMTIGERRIRGIIREREEAQQIYDDAKRQGHVASLLTQERANIFMQRVANIEPGKRIDVDITYFNTLAYDDGWYEFVYPMVVGPRFNPPGTTDGVAAIARGAGGTSWQSTEVQYLAPNERSGHDIALAVEITAGVTVEEIRSPSHEVEITGQGSEHLHVALSDIDAIPNRDFVLRYRVAGDAVKTALLTHKGDDGGYFTFMLYPPQDIAESGRRPMEMIFVLDCSGSMAGTPLRQAKKAITHALGQLRPDDTFQIVRFSSNASTLGPVPVPATKDNVRRGRKYVSGLTGSGGTMMIAGIKAALDFDHDPERLRVVTFLTDGFIGNEAQILGAVHDHLGAARVFSFGVGSAPNRYLMNRMAKLGNGAVAYLGLNDDGGDVMDRFFARVSHPVLTDITVDWGDLDARDVVPARIPDLFVGRPVIVTGRFDGEEPTEIRVEGRAADDIVRATFDVTPASDTHAALRPVWARLAIAELADRATYDPDVELPQRITEIALEHGLMSAYTSFVAVDSLTKTKGDHGTTVHVAVPVPEGVRYDTTVGR